MARASSSSRSGGGWCPTSKSSVNRFAADGFVALAPDLFHGVTTGEPDEGMRLMMGLAMDTAAQDIAGAAQYLFEHDSTNGDGIGVVGFCMGGSLALWSATSAPMSSPPLVSIRRCRGSG